MAVTSPFVVDVGRLLRHPGERRGVQFSEPVAGTAVTGSRVPPASPVNADLTLESLTGGAILVTGTVTGPWEGECRRCLQPASGAITAQVRELYEPPGAGDPEETYPLTGEQVDLEPLVRDVVLLELPQAPLCHEGCLGLCPTCGINRNEGTCECEPDEPDPRWAALDELK